MEINKWDILWCKMPAHDKELEQISIQHRTRPYIVLEANEKNIVALKCTSKHIQNNFIGCLLPNKDYSFEKVTYVKLNGKHTIPCGNIQRKMGKLRNGEILKIERRLKILSGKKILLEVGDVIDINGILYYIYYIDNNIHMLEISKTKNTNPITINYQEYYSLNKYKKIPFDSNYPIVDIATNPENIINLKEIKQDRQDNIKKCKDDNLKKYDVGMAFKKDNATYVYLFIKNNRYYCIDYNFVSLNPILIEFNEIPKGNFYIKKEELLKLLSNFDKNNNQARGKILKICNKIKKELY